MSTAILIVLLVALERAAELVYARRNTKRLLAEGGIEWGAGHYPFLVALHAGWLLAILVLADADQPLDMSLLIVFLALQGARLWVIMTLGRYWTTRIITLPGVPLVRRGPYRYLRHPNYAIVVAEIAVLPLVFGAWRVALVFSLLNLALLRHRIRVENQALAERPASA